MISMKIYDRKGGQNVIEVYPVNDEGLVTFLYSKNKMRVSMNRTEVFRLLKFLSLETENMPINNGEVKDKISNT